MEKGLVFFFSENKILFYFDEKIICRDYVVWNFHFFFFFFFFKIEKKQEKSKQIIKLFLKNQPICFNQVI